MTLNLTAGAYLSGATYTPSELRDLIQAVGAWLDTNENEARLEIVMLYVHAHMMAGHKAGDI